MIYALETVCVGHGRLRISVKFDSSRSGGRAAAAAAKAAAEQAERSSALVRACALKFCSPNSSSLIPPLHDPL